MADVTEYGIHEWTAPTGKSVYELQTGEDDRSISGSGFHRVGVGYTLLAITNTWDWNAGLFIQNGISRHFNQVPTAIDVQPGRTYETLFSAGKTWGKHRFGGQLSWLKTDEKTIDRQGQIEISPGSAVWPVQVSYSYILPEWAFAISYRDDTLLGPAQNTTLTRKMIGSMTYRYF
jgi:hypothetical protein